MLTETLFSISTPEEFTEVSLAVFRFQYDNNPVYRKFCDLLKTNPKKVDIIEKIPFLPIGFFKSHTVISSTEKTKLTFTSSGTTGSQTSKHYLTDNSLLLYKKSFFSTFSKFYGAVEDYVVLALLPSYLERTGSSLVYMADAFIKKSKYTESGFYLNQLDTLAQKLKTLDATHKKVLLIGVSFALLDLVAHEQFQLKNTIIMETGGMKGRRKEMVREKLHQVLQKGFGVSQIHSEYGMTELLSQAYAQKDGVFHMPNYMDVLIRDPEDALRLLPEGKNGGINIIDLANIYSCSFIATQDLGRKTGADSFEVLGRFDHSDLRGCNLLVV